MKVSKDLHNNIKVVHAITPQAAGTTGSSNGRLSPAIDRAGYDSLEFVYSAGTSASAADTITPVVLEGDTTNGAFTSAADADLIGTEGAITLSAAATKKVGYKRYAKLRLYGVGTATAIISGTAILSTPAAAPVA